MKSVQVLLSTYNGEAFLAEQIRSILQQRDVAVNLRVRDDGSTDKTIEILNDFQQNGALTYSVGDNIKPARSFMTLLQQSDDADFYAFSDQDDFWMNDKLSAAVKQLENNADKPALYFSRTTLADADLKPIGCVEINPKLTFGESLVYEFVAGCTIVMNRSLRDILANYMPQHLAMHDVWVYSVALAIGATVIFDPQSHILYRQHAHNAIGQHANFYENWRRRLRRLTHNEQERYHRACEIKQGFYAMMTKENQNLINDFINAKHCASKRLKLARDARLHCANTATWHRFQLAALLNTY